MADPFISQISMVGFDFPPKGWAKCDGSSLTVSGHQALYSIIGVAFGGDGIYNFNLPDVRGRSPVHIGHGYSRGHSGGAELVNIQGEQTPPHKHTATASSNAGSSRTVTIGPLLGEATANVYATPPSSGQLISMNDDTLVAVGHGQGHENRQPYTVLNFIIALTGTFPPRT